MDEKYHGGNFIGMFFLQLLIRAALYIRHCKKTVARYLKIKTFNFFWRQLCLLPEPCRISKEFLTNAFHERTARSS